MMSSAEPIAGPPPGPTADLDRLVLDALKDVHNRGADLYNGGDPTGCLRLYEGGLVAVRAFLAHRPPLQRLLAAGLAEVGRSAGVKIQAYRLHEVIEQVRGELKADVRRGDVGREPPTMVVAAGGWAAAAAPVTPAPAAADPGGVGGVAGRVAVDGRPAGGVELTFAGLDPAARQVFTAATVADGGYLVLGLPPGRYAVTAVGPRVPARYRTAATSGLTVAVSAGLTDAHFELRT